MHVQMDRFAASMKDMGALPFVALSIGAFLDTSDLAACERAQIFSTEICDRLWEVLGSHLLEATALWSNFANQLVDNSLHGKELISQIMFSRRAVFPPKCWRPWIKKTSFRSLKATPHLCVPCGGQSNRIAGVGSAKPDRACVVMPVGAYRGQTLVVGVKFAAAKPIEDSLRIGIEAIECPCSGRMMSISLAPFSGMSFIEHENGLTMLSQALPREAWPHAVEGCVWIHVTEKGGIRFLRQFKGGQLQDSKLLPQLLPNWVQSFFGSIDIWFRDLEVAVDVSVEHSGCTFPNDVPICDFIKHEIEMDTIWSVQRSKV
mmetsp:Transcript_779/g.1452  ORF Transcript_779/g.1452 Transcript_779/m.1452 type:complete len:317 (+) Transcript_779:33-983(+)